MSPWAWVLALAGGVVGIPFLATEFSLWGILSGFCMGFLYLGVVGMFHPTEGSLFEQRVAGGIAGALAGCAGWWIHEGVESMTIWALVGVVLGVMFSSGIASLIED